MENSINSSQIADVENLSEFDEWVHNGLDKAEEMIKDTAKK